MKNKNIKKALLSLYQVAENKCDEFEFFRINEYYTHVLEYIEYLENKIELDNEINRIKEVLNDK